MTDVKAIEDEAVNTAKVVADRLDADALRELWSKDGWKTTEFWLALAGLLIGCWLIQRGHDELGTLICGGSIGGFKVSRTLVKTAAIRHVSALLLCLGLLPLLAGCGAYDLDPQNVGPGMTTVLDRHDAYVQHDTSLSEDERRIFLLTSQLVRDDLKQAGYPPVPEPGH